MEIANFCRICAKEKKPTVPILENNPLNILDKLQKLLKIKVSDNSSLPKQICLDCLSKLNHFNEFYVQTHENQVILKILFNSNDEEVETAGSHVNKPLTDASTQTNASAEDDNHFYIIEEIEAEDSESQKLEEESSQDSETKPVEKDSFKIVETSSTDAPVTKKKKYNRFDCFICKNSLNGNFQFIQHFNTEHPNDTLSYQCYVCDSQLKSYRSYTRHIESHFEKRFGCNICGLKFSQKITLISHLNSHSNVKKFSCSVCNVSFKQHSSLFKHKKQKHSSEVQFHCDACKRSFVCKETLQQHLKSKHNMSKDISCEECQKKFASKSALIYHRTANHSKNENSEVKCSKCDEKFKHNLLLVRHMKKCNKNEKHS